MSKRKELREKLQTLGKEIKTIADTGSAHEAKGESWPADLEERWNAVNDDFNAASKDLDRLDRLAEVEARTAEPADREMRGKIGSAWKKAGREKPEDDEGGEEEVGSIAELRERRALVEYRFHEAHAYALQGWCRYNQGLELRREHEQAMKVLGMRPDQKTFEFRALPQRYDRLRRAFELEKRALSTTATEGGDTIPEGFVADFERALLEFGGVRENAEVIRTATGNDLPWPTVNDTGNVGEILAENTEDAEEDIVTSALVLGSYKYTSNLVRVSSELLEDSAFDMSRILGEILGERIGRATNADFTTGAGSAGPKGIVTAATVGVTAAAVAAITADELIDLFHSVGRAYRKRPSCKWMMADGVVKLIRKLKDDNNDYLWQSGLKDGRPDTLLGYPVVINDDMDAVPAANDLVALFGDLRSYKIRDVATFRLRRAEERYVEYDQIGFVAFSRHDGDLLDAGTHPVKSLKMAAS